MAKAITQRVIPSSGNVFADMGLPDAAELDTKARLAAAINRIVERRRLTQAEVAVALEINQPKVSALLHYKLEGFSVERLMRFLVALGQDVEIVVKAKPRTRSARLTGRNTCPSVTLAGPVHASIATSTQAGIGTVRTRPCFPSRSTMHHRPSRC